MPLKAQATTDQTPSANSRTTPAWQIAAGGKMEFHVASIKLGEQGKFTSPNIALNIDDTPIPPGGPSGTNHNNVSCAGVQIADLSFVAVAIYRLERISLSLVPFLTPQSMRHMSAGRTSFV